MTQPDNEASNTLFPVFLKTAHLHTLIVGGGAVGLEKLSALLGNCPEAQVTLVAPEIDPAIRSLAQSAPNVELAERPFSSCDLYDKDLAIVATADAALNASIRDMAKARRVLVNVADTPALCDFYLGSIVSKGSVKIAISTNGKSPTVAKRMREVLTEIIPDEMEGVLQHLGEIRSRLRGDFAAKVRRLNEITAVLAGKDDPA